MKEEVEFVDDYERPKLEKYEKITPTPLAKKDIKDKVSFSNHYKKNYT